MNAVSRFDASRPKRGRGLPKHLRWAIYGAGAFVAVALIFQLFFRYEFIQNQGTLWRVDRLTQQTCQVSIGQADCTPGSDSGSPASGGGPSTSTSTSTSLSTSVNLKLPKKH